jgi:hypothetical protein
MTGWLLKQLSIEGFRGINNEGDPLALKFKPEKINSVFAQNGIGKTSIFDALTYALSGRIVRLDELPAAENGESYYLNRFHRGGTGTIVLTLTPDGVGADVEITVVHRADGTRSVTTSDGCDGEALLSELNREFVLLDAKTFQKFIDDKPLNRGRSFAGLLGLGGYSTLRQSLKAASNTRAFNGHFGVTARTGERSRALGHISTAGKQVGEAYYALTGEKFDPSIEETSFEAKVHDALASIALIKPHCEDKKFSEISLDECLETVKTAEGGADKDRLVGLIRSEASLTAAIKLIPSEIDVDRLVSAAKKRDQALANTQGDTFLGLYRMAASIIGSDTWTDKHVCPVCDRRSENSLVPHIDTKVAHYDAVTEVTEVLKAEWKARSWDELTGLEGLVLDKGEPRIIHETSSAIAAGGFTEAAALTFKSRIEALGETAAAKLNAITSEKDLLEKRLPPSMVSVTEKVEAARRLQAAIKAHKEAHAELAAIDNQIERIDRVKSFLDQACSIFAAAESEAATRRLAAVEPICRDYFANIMHQQVIPAISKPAGSEDLSISLTDFHSLPGVSAPSVLSESFRNAFSISVYLAAASLYGGAAKFIVLDDITSSFDAGHQFFLMEVIRTRFARPGSARGPQVILLSHDTLLEKYFNTQTGSGQWWHQRIEGNPRTAVLPQDNAVSRIRDRTLDLLNAGNTADAAPRVRQYLEFKLEEIISKCRIAVPMDIAISDDKHVCSNLLTAIDTAVKLHAAANQLVLEPAQVTGLNTAAATIMSNYLSHWMTGQTQAFSPGALMGVMSAIDNYADCFRFEPNPGAPRRYYHSLGRR